MKTERLLFFLKEIKNRIYSNFLERQKLLKGKEIIYYKMFLIFYLNILFFLSFI